MKKTKTIITIAVIIIIALLAYFVFNYINTMQEKITKQSIEGTWTAVSEEVKGEVNTEVEDTSITFNPDDTYTSVSYGFEEAGFYKIDEKQDIYLYEDEAQLSTPSMFVVFAEKQDDTLTLTYPQYPKTVIYKKA